MPTGRNIRLILAAALLGAGAVLLWHLSSTNAPRTSLPAQPRHPQSVQIAVPSPLAPHSSGPSASVPGLDLRTEFRHARNYAQFVRRLAGADAAGDPIAEYLTARALKYCSDTAHLGFRNANGSLRMRGEVEARYEKFPAGVQQQMLETFDRCRELWTDPNWAQAAGAWADWLDKASAAGYPPAQSLRADVTRDALVMHEAGKAQSGDIIVPPAGPARDLALRAVLTGDPDSIFEMMNWIDGTKHSQEDSGDLLMAWRLLSCQRGQDDCGPDSEWLRTICIGNAMCAEGDSVRDSLKQMLGVRFEEVQKLATEIGVAIDHRDLNAVESYL
jgi:hypothetical protein